MLTSVFYKIYLEGVGIAEFRHYLTAYAARRALAIEDVICTARNGYSDKVGLAFAYRLEKGDPLGTDGWGICGIFDITAGIYFSRAAQKCRAYLEA